MNAKVVEVKVHYNDYVVLFYKRDKHRRWRRFACVGNLEVGQQFADMLRKLKHPLTVVDYTRRS